MIRALSSARRLPIFRIIAALPLLALAAGCALPPALPPPPSRPAPAVLSPVDWSALPAWQANDAAQSWGAFIASCSALARRAEWQAPCAAAQATTPVDDASARAFFEHWFVPHRVSSEDGSERGLITGYYEPLLYGSRTPSDRYRYPLYGVPDDLLVIDLASVYPELRNYRLRGRLVGRRVVPYYSRAEIDNGTAPLAGREIVWVDDEIALFFLQIQGSGRVQLENGEVVRVGYADQNGHPYTSIGRKLVEWGELTLDEASMQGIKAWALRNPDKLATLLNANASYVFFRELPPSPNGPPGALGVPLTGGRSLAVDPRSVPLGAPVYLETTWPNRSETLTRLMLAQDTGGAIKGAVRADFFWGFGEEAGKLAGAMRQQGRMWVLLPRAAANAAAR